MVKAQVAEERWGCTPSGLWIGWTMLTLPTLHWVRPKLVDQFLHWHPAYFHMHHPSTKWHSKPLSHILCGLWAGPLTSKKVSLHCKQYWSLLGCTSSLAGRFAVQKAQGTVIVGRKWLEQSTMSNQAAHGCVWRRDRVNTSPPTWFTRDPGTHPNY